MIKFSASWAVTLRHLRVIRRDLNFVMGYFYWPVLDVLIWGFVGSWIAQSHAGGLENYQVTALLGILLWQIVGRGSIAFLSTFNEEVWNYNLVNVFSSPLSLGSWMGGALMFTGIIMSMTAGICMSVIFLLYDVPWGQMLTTFVLCAPPLCIASMWVGFTCLQVVTTFGKRGTELGYVIGWCLMPLSGAYYPIEVLPPWGQALSRLLPMSYVFQGMRVYTLRGEDMTPWLMQGYMLGTVYMLVAMGLFVVCFNRSKQRGLARLSD